MSEIFVSFFWVWNVSNSLRLVASPPCDGSHHHLLFFSVVSGYVRRSSSCWSLLFLSLFSRAFSCHLDIHYLLVIWFLRFLSFFFSQVFSILTVRSLSLLLIVNDSCPSSSSFNKFVDTHPLSSSLSSLFVHPQAWLLVLRSAVVLEALHPPPSGRPLSTAHRYEWSDYRLQ